MPRRPRYRRRPSLSEAPGSELLVGGRVLAGSPAVGAAECGDPIDVLLREHYAEDCEVLVLSGRCRAALRAERRALSQ